MIKDKSNVPIWIKPGLLIYYSSSLHADSHRHHAIQIVLPQKGAQSTCLSKYGEHTGSVIIDSQVEHELNLTEGWIILVEPYSNLGQKLKKFIAGNKVMSFTLPRQISSPDEISNKNINRIFLPCLRLLSHLAGSNVEKANVDPRITKIIQVFDHCLDGQCVKPPKWHASEVAQDIGLSESRFLHLFRESVGIAWRPYLRWKRLHCAINYLLRDYDATYAALSAGFSDSAHFSRTFKEMFGLSLRQLKSGMKGQKSAPKEPSRAASRIETSL